MSKKPTQANHAAADIHAAALSTADGHTVKEVRAATEARTAAPASPVFLEHVKVTSFGRFANLIVGPFKPGLNVVYGPNEAGKTTITQLVKGVLFGWPRARAGANSYRPETAERVGSLFFTDATTGKTTELKRVKGTDEPTDEFGVLEGIDSDTYETMFSLTSGELMNLERHDDVTARLLTAGSGTGNSPAHALASIESQIKALLSRSSQYPDSVTNLNARNAELRTRMVDGRDEAEQFRRKEKMLDELQPRREMLAATQNRLNDEIEELRSLRAQVASLDESIAATRDSLAYAIESERDTHRDPLDETTSPRKLRDLTQAEEYRLRDSLDDLEESQRQSEHALELAKRDAAKSRVEFDTLINDRDLEEEQRKAARQRKVQLVLAAVIPCMLALMAGYFIYRFFEHMSLTMLIVAAFVILVMLVVSVGGIVMNLRPSKVEEQLAERRKKAEWVMQQDAKLVAACESEVTDQQAKIDAFFGASNLEQAHGSIKRARHLLDEARDARLEQVTKLQNRKALALQIGSLEAEIDHLEEKRRELCAHADLPPYAELADFDAVINTKADERTRTIELASETNSQYGRITQELEQAKALHGFDETKLALTVNDARLKESYRQLVRLLIAKHALENAIATWERKSQPEVYRRASELFSQMTNGAWRQVRMNAAGQIEVVDAVRTVRSPNLLSTGTRQQLYLALRIALLLTATRVGASLPIMCDDILVHFDPERRKQAARALATLAGCRQVILFTCDPTVADLLRGVVPESNYIEL